MGEVRLETADGILTVTLAEEVPVERVREQREKDCPNDRAIWGALAELGVTGMLVPETQGGPEYLRNRAAELQGFAVAS